MARDINTASKAIEAAVKQDAELAEAARALANKAIVIATRYLESGSPQMQLRVIQSLLPAIAKGLHDKGESEQLAMLREELALLHEVVLGQSVA